MLLFAALDDHGWTFSPAPSGVTDNKDGNLFLIEVSDEQWQRYAAAASVFHAEKYNINQIAGAAYQKHHINKMREANKKLIKTR